MAPMMRYWARMATRAEVRASAATASVVMIPTHRASSTGKALTTDSAKPTVYRATDRPWARRITRKLFAGSPELLLTHLVDGEDLSEDELRRMQELLAARLEAKEGER